MSDIVFTISDIAILRPYTRVSKKIFFLFFRRVDVTKTVDQRIRGKRTNNLSNIMNKKILIGALLGLTLCANTSCANSKNANSNEYDEELVNAVINDVDNSLKPLKSSLKSLDNSLKSIETNDGEEGESVSKTFDLKNFSKITSCGIANIYFTQENNYYVKAEGTPELMKKLIINNNNGNLTIDFKSTSGRYQHAFMNIYISAPNMTYVELSGACKFEAKEIDSSTFTADFSGATRCNIGLLKGKKTKLDFSGATRVNMNVESDDLDVECSGATNGILKFKGNNIDVDNSGAGKLEIDVNCRTLKSDNSGASKIVFTGTADNTNIENSGVAKTNTKGLNNF